MLDNAPEYWHIYVDTDGTPQKSWKANEETKKHDYYLEAYFNTGRKIPVPYTLRWQDGQPPVAAGYYLLAPESFVFRGGKVVLGFNPKLIAVQEKKTGKAA